MKNFSDREQSIRDFFRHKIDNNGESLNSISREVGVLQSTLSNFLGAQSNNSKSAKPVSLSKSVYNRIVNSYKDLDMDVRLMDFPQLVRLLENTTKNSIRWDFFYHDYCVKEIEIFSNFRDFVTKDTSSISTKTSLLNMINPPPESENNDIFKKFENLSKAKESFKERFNINNFKVWGGEYHHFLRAGDDKEIFILLAFDEKNEHGDMIRLEKKGLFNPKQKKKRLTTKKSKDL